jgi:hypothetical protein
VEGVGHSMRGSLQLQQVPVVAARFRVAQYQLLERWKFSAPQGDW